MPGTPVNYYNPEDRLHLKVYLAGFQDPHKRVFHSFQDSFQDPSTLNSEKTFLEPMLLSER